MEKTIEIPEGYEARIEGNKVILELKESEDERIREAIESIIRVYGKTQGEWIAGYDMDTLVVHLRDAFAYLERQKEQKPFPAEDEKDFLEKEVKAFLCNYDKEFDDDAPTYDIAEHFYQLGKNSQKPAEWSEEYERLLNIIIDILDKEEHNGHLSHDDLISSVKLIKSLRPQLTEEELKKIRSEEYTKGFNDAAFGGKAWKPSKDQIDDLQMLLDDLDKLDNKNKVKMIKVFHWSENYKNLKELLDNLKKL